MASRISSQRDLSVLDRIPGRPRLLTPDRWAKIIEEIAKHGKHTLAARVAGVAQSTVSNWLDRGVSYAARLEAGGEVEDLEEDFLNFAIDVARAEARFETDCLAGVVEIGRPHDVLVEKTVEVVDGKVDADGKQIGIADTKTTTSTERRRVGDWQALVYALSRISPEEYDRIARTELSGVDGTPIETNSTMTVRNESDEFYARVLEGVRDARRGTGLVPPSPALGAGDTEDDVVDAASHEVHAPEVQRPTNGVRPPQ